MTKILPTEAEITKRYEYYADCQLREIKENMTDIKQADYNVVALKKPHGTSMASSLRKTAIETGLFNESYHNSFSVDGALHDVARFQQFKLIGNLEDSHLCEKTSINDHGKLGKKILLDNNGALLKIFIPESKLYYPVITEVVGEHTITSNPVYTEVNFSDKWSNYDLEEILKSSDKKIKEELIALKIKLLQEVDGLEMFQNIVSGAWKPAISGEKNDPVHKDVWDSFVNFKDIDLGILKAQGKWNCNDGFVFRYGLLINKTNLVANLKHIYNEGYIEQIWKRANENCTNNQDKPSLIIDPLLEGAEAYCSLALKNLINCSEGIFVTPESRQTAKQKTLSQWQEIKSSYMRPFN